MRKYNKSIKSLAILLAAALTFSSPVMAVAEDTDNPVATLPEGNLIAYYPFEGDLVNQVTNESATYVKNVTLADTTSAGNNGFDDEGKVGKAALFGGGTSTGTALKLDTKITTTDCTISFWLKVKTMTAFTSILFWPHGTSANDYSNLMVYNYHNGTGASPEWASGDITTSKTYSNTNTANPIIENEWKHFTYVVTGDKLTLYVNGEESPLTKAEGKIFADHIKDKTIIMGGNFWDTALDGLVDELYIYERAVTAEEASNIYEVSGGEFYTEINFTSDSYDLVINPKIHETDQVSFWANGYKNGGIAKVTYAVAEEGKDIIDFTVNEAADSNGRETITVTAKKEGTAKVLASITGRDGTVETVTCTINITSNLGKINLSQTSANINLKIYSGKLQSQTLQLKATIWPENPIDGNIVWSSSDSSIAEVNQQGLVNFKKKGKVDIIVSSVSNPEIKTKCAINVTETRLTNTLTLNKKKATIYTKGTKSITLKVSKLVGPSSKVTWKSLNPSFATVNGSGKVTAKKAGTATISATANGITSKVTITIKKPSITVKRGSKVIKKNSVITIKKNSNLTLKVTAAPNAKVTYKSSVKKVATITNKGVIKAKKKGTTTITVKNGSLVSTMFKVKITD